MTIQQFSYISGQAWSSKIAPTSDHDIAHSWYDIAQLDKDENTIKTTHLVCRRAALNEAFLFTKETSNIDNIKTETDITTGNN